MNSWLRCLLVFVLTKLLADVASAVMREKRFVFFEDYLRELLLFSGVAALCVLGVAAVQYYLHGKIWFPLLAAAAVMVWRR